MKLMEGLKRRPHEVLIHEDMNYKRRRIDTESLSSDESYSPDSSSSSSDTDVTSYTSDTSYTDSSDLSGETDFSDTLVMPGKKPLMTIIYLYSRKCNIFIRKESYNIRIFLCYRYRYLL